MCPCVWAACALLHRYQDAALSRIAFNLMLTVSRPVMYLTPRINHLQLLAPEEVARQRATMMGLMQAGEVCPTSGNRSFCTHKHKHNHKAHGVVRSQESQPRSRGQVPIHSSLLRGHGLAMEARPRRVPHHHANCNSEPWVITEMFSTSIFLPAGNAALALCVWKRTSPPCPTHVHILSHPRRTPPIGPSINLASSTLSVRVLHCPGVLAVHCMCKQVRRSRSVNLEAAMAMDTPLPIRATSVRWRTHRSTHSRKSSSGQPYGRSPGHVGRGSVVPVTGTLDSKESDGVALSRASSGGGGKVTPEEADVMAQVLDAADHSSGAESRFSKLLQWCVGCLGPMGWGGGRVC